MVALLRTGRRPWVEYAELVEERGSAAAVLEDELEREAAPDGQTSLLDAPPESADEVLDQARTDLERWTADGMRLVTVLDPDYPPNLRAVHDRPPMVFVAGDLTPRTRAAIAVVGARKATGAGIERARGIAEHLVECGYTVVSGSGRRHRHRGPHRRAGPRGGRTVAVIGTGLARSYPPQNAALQRRIAVGVRGDLAVLAGLPSEPPQLPDAQRGDVGHRAGHRGGRGVGHERRADAGAARAAPTDGRCSCSPRWSSDSRGRASSPRRPARMWCATPDEITTVVERLISPGALVA